MEVILHHMQHFRVRVQYTENVLICSLEYANHTSSDCRPRFEIRSTVRNSQKHYPNRISLNLFEMLFSTVLGMGESLLCDQAAKTMCNKDNLSRFCLTSCLLPYKPADQALSMVRESAI